MDLLLSFHAKSLSVSTNKKMCAVDSFENG
jgi:hypothetical protein